MCMSHIYMIYDFVQTWMYLSVPVGLYVGERTLRFFRSGSYSVRLLKVTPEESRNLSIDFVYSSLIHSCFAGGHISW